MTDAAFHPLQRLTPRATMVAIAAVMAVMIAVLFAMGRTPICTCGTIKFWHSAVQSSENSQHLFDWYSFTHVLHGFWLYVLGWLLLRRWPIAARLLLAVVLEAGWEVLENTSFVIDRYRATTISLNYYGDSIVNSLGDVVSMIIGFGLARVIPLWASVGAIIVIEIALIYLIRDNLFLNVLMLMYPIDGIRTWQTGSPL